MILKSINMLTTNRIYFLRRCSSLVKVVTESEKNEETDLDLKSCLAIPGDKANKFVAVLKPKLNFEKIFSIAENNLKHRKIVTNVKQLENGWRDLVKVQLEQEEIQTERKRLKECLKSHVDIKIDEDLEKLSEKFNQTLQHKYQLENDVLIPILQLPNELHPKTPINEDKIQFEYLSIPKFDFKPNSHVEIGKMKKEIIFSDMSPTSYFLCENAALFELNSINYFINVHESSKFMQTSNPDLCKPPLVEGCGNGFLDRSKSFVLTTDESGSAHHLVGGASLESFYGYFMRRSVENITRLPLRYFCTGRHYDINFDASLGLLQTIQSCRVNFFIVIDNDNEKTNQEHEKMVELLTNEYKKLGIHFRVVNLCASKLNFTQSLKSSFQMWSPSLDKYVEIGHVSICGDFISRRLMAQYGDKNVKNKVMYLNVVHGVSVNATRLLACIMENTQNSKGGWVMPKNYF